MILALGLAVAAQVAPGRFQPVAPFPRLPWITIDQRWAGGSFADEVCRKQGLQGRVLWIDGTANLDTINSEEKIVGLVSKIKNVGFNTIVLDVKPIVGRTLYPSKFTEQMTSWKGLSMPKGFDPVSVFRAQTKAKGLSFLVSLNAFSEGHSYAKRDEAKADTQFGAAGWGYEHPELQSVLYKPQPVLVVRSAAGPKQFELHPAINPAEWTTGAALFDKLPVPKVENATYVTVDKRLIVTAASKLPPSQLATAEQVIVVGSQLAEATPGDKVEFDSAGHFRPSSVNQDQIPLMMNPNLPENQRRVLDFVREVVAKYRPDGVLFDDRYRFHGLDADFSEFSRAAFEKRVGSKLKWPDDVYKVTMNGLKPAGIRPGPFFDAWLSWRAETMAVFAQRVKAEIKRANAQTLFGIYAGSWYGDYAKYGTNYASDGLQAGFPFLTRTYKEAGFSKNLDLLVTGCYYKTGTMFEAMGAGKPIGQTVEAAGDVSNRVAKDGCWVYAGIQLADFFDEPKRLEAALQAAAASTQGVMVFDLSHKIETYWPVFERAFSRQTKPPHMNPGLLDKVRKSRAQWEAKGHRERPFPILEGAPGAGF